MAKDLKFVIACFYGLPENEFFFLKRIIDEFDFFGVKCIEAVEISANDSVSIIRDYGCKPYEGIIIASSHDFDEKLPKTGITTVVYDENEGRALPYGIDLIAESFEEMGAYFLIKIWNHKNKVPCVISVSRRTVIKELSEREVDEIIKISRQWHILRFVEDGRVPENEQREKLLAYIENVYKFYDFGIWGIFEKNTGILIGAISLDLINGNGAEYEVGFFVRKEMTGWGFCSEALEAVINYAKLFLEATKIFALTDRENKPVIKLLKKFGFKELNYADRKTGLWKKKYFVKILNV